MNLSRPARQMTGFTLLTVPTIVYGGLTVLGIVTARAHGLPPGAELTLTPLQQSLFRAGHAHAGVLVLLSLVIQVLLDATVLREPTRWVARIAAVAAAVLLSGGFFGVAFDPRFAAMLWVGAASLVVTVVVTGVGLLRSPGSAARRAGVAALALAVGLGASDGVAAEPGRIEVTVSGVSSAPGLVGCALFAAPTGFPTDSAKHAVAQVRAAAVNGTATCVFEAVAPGEFAVAVVHDANGDDRANTNFLGIPTEGVGVSRNALPRMSAPSFDACRFPVAAGQTARQAIVLRY